MKTITLSNTVHKLVDYPNVSLDRLQATILKEEYTIEEIIDSAKNNEEITVKDGNVTVGVYNGYTDFINTTVYENNGETVVSLELANNDVKSQLKNVLQKVTAISDAQEAQSSMIDSLNKQAEETEKARALTDATLDSILTDIIPSLMSE